MNKLQTALALAAIMLLTAHVAQASTGSDTNWAGAYAGGSVGSRTTQTDWETRDYTDPSGAPVGFFVSSPVALFDATAVSFTGFAGYTWVLPSKWTIGFEGDVGYGDNSVTNDIIPGTLDFPFDYAYITTKQTIEASARVRAGYLVNDTVHLFGTGGLSATQIDLEAICPADGDFCNPAAGTQRASDSKILFGWTAGAGAEVAVAEHLIGRVEYNNAYYGTTNFTGIQATPDTYGFNARTEHNSQALRVGLAYKF